MAVLIEPLPLSTDLFGQDWLRQPQQPQSLHKEAAVPRGARTEPKNAARIHSPVTLSPIQISRSEFFREVSLECNMQDDGETLRNTWSAFNAVQETYVDPAKREGEMAALAESR